MNKAELKKFAVESRENLIKQIKTKALVYGIDEKNNLDFREDYGQIIVNNVKYKNRLKPAFIDLKKQLGQKGYKQLIEEVAYTWFNRIIAIRYMELNGYLPGRVGVLTSNEGRKDPDILIEYREMDLPIDEVEIQDIIGDKDSNSRIPKIDRLYRQLFIAQCNSLHKILPFMFEEIPSYIELLLPDFLLDPNSIIKKLVGNEELTKSFQEIEVIGWLYQYYIADEKDRVFAQKSKYTKEEIPFATQLFTPKWIVQYMVQNSLGRYWTEAHREDEDLINDWTYFIKHEDEDFHEKIAPYVNKELRVEDIKLLDPAMGSGHILVYAFEVFYQIYEKCGYLDREIPRLILENNLYGLDIDDRAYQLAAFALVMKASSYSKRFLRNIEKEPIQLNLASIQETNYIEDDVISYIAQEDKGANFDQVKALFRQYYNGKTYGSLINITEKETSFIENRLKYISLNPASDLFYTKQHEMAKKILPDLIKQTKIMSNKYDILVMNPPYMGNGSMGKELIDFLKKNYKDSKADLFSAFMEMDYFLKKKGMYAAINQHSWMFLSSFEKLREKIISTKFIDTMLHLGPKAFEEINGEVVQSTTFVLRNVKVNHNKGVYLRLVDFKSPKEKKQQAISLIRENSDFKFEFLQNAYTKIPGNPLAYWLNENVIKLFAENDNIGESSYVKKGMFTGNNDRFIRFWFEVDFNSIGYNLKSLEEAFNSQKKWFPTKKGGEYRKWYGNDLEVVAMNRESYQQIEMANGHRSPTLYFKPSISWSSVTSGNFSCRYSDFGFINNTASMSLFYKEVELDFLLALLNSKLIVPFLNQLSPTLNYTAGDIERIPLIECDSDKKNEIQNISANNIQLSKLDWDSFELSADFLRHPFLNNSSETLKDSYEKWEKFTDKQFNILKQNEEKINEIFIETYNLNDELTANLEDKDITIRKANRNNDVKSFLSYFIGCVLGRYSLNVPGLFYAGGKWNEDVDALFKANKNGLVHFTHSMYFEDDILLLLKNFLAITFSESGVEENLQWIADSLSIKKGESAESRLRRYFMDEFFVDHCKTYQKRPIYWLVDSGKQKGLRTLIYMHRYQKDTMATIRFEHLQEMQAKYQNEINDLDNRLVNPNLSAAEKKKILSEKISFEKKIDELRDFDKRLAEIANKEIQIDFDDGVKVNYEKFYLGGKGVLAKIK